MSGATRSSRVVGSTSSINPCLPPYNVLPGVTPNPEVGIQAAIDQARANLLAGSGPVVVDARGAVFTGAGLHVIPGQTSVAACIWRYTGVELRNMKIVAAPALTLPATTTQAHGISVLNPYAQALSDTQQDLRLDHVHFDGNAASQALDPRTGNPVFYHGIFDGGVKRFLNTNCFARGVYGTDTSPPGETMHFEANHGAIGTYIHCEADGSDSANTATGFSGDYAQDLAYYGCRSHDMGRSHGFTSFACAKVQYYSGSAWNNAAGAGINSEICETVIISGGSYGGRSVNPGQSFANVYFPNTEAVQGNKWGILLQGAKDAVVTGVAATFNATNFEVRDTNYGASHPLNRASDGVQVAGCDFRYSTGNSSDGTKDVVVATTTLNFSIEALSSPKASAYGAQPARMLMGSNLVEAFHNNTTTNSGNGWRGYMIGHARTAAGHAWRWLYEATSGASTVALRINGIGQLQTFGRARTRVAKSAAYTVTANDDILEIASRSASFDFTLPALSSIELGTEFEAIDLTTSGSGTVRFGRGSTDVFLPTLALASGGGAVADGAVSVTIPVGGRVKVYATLDPADGVTRKWKAL